MLYLVNVNTHKPLSPPDLESISSPRKCLFIISLETSVKAFPTQHIIILLNFAFCMLFSVNNSSAVNGH